MLCKYKIVRFQGKFCEIKLKLYPGVFVSDGLRTFSLKRSTVALFPCFWCQAFSLIIFMVEKCLHFDIWNEKKNSLHLKNDPNHREDYLKK